MFRSPKKHANLFALLRNIARFTALSFLVLLMFPWFLSNALSEVGGDPKVGKEIYMKRCASCHGREGEGLGKQTNIPTFNDAKYMAARSDDELLAKIATGGEGTGMPAFNSILSDETRRHVLAFIRTLPRL